MANKKEMENEIDSLRVSNREADRFILNLKVKIDTQEMRIEKNDRRIKQIKDVLVSGDEQWSQVNI